MQGCTSVKKKRSPKLAGRPTGRGRLNAVESACLKLVWRTLAGGGFNRGIRQPGQPGSANDTHESPCWCGSIDPRQHQLTNPSSPPAASIEPPDRVAQHQRIRTLCGLRGGIQRLGLRRAASPKIPLFLPSGQQLGRAAFPPPQTSSIIMIRSHGARSLRSPPCGPTISPATARPRRGLHRAP